MIDEDDLHKIDENYLIFPLTLERVLRIICNLYYKTNRGAR